MRKVFMLGAAILLAGSVGVAVAQERLPQASGFGTGVGESAGTGTRSQIWDKAALLERLSQPETIFGRVQGINYAGKRIHLETGGSSHDLGRVGLGETSEVVAYFDDHTNMEKIRTINNGDDVYVLVDEEKTAAQPFGTGRKLVRDIAVLRPNEKLVGFGGLGQRPDPKTERGIVTENFSSHGGIVGQVLPGDINKALGFTSNLGEVTGTAPCWQCDPQPGWGNTAANKSDWGSSDKPNYEKGLGPAK
ncbi:MAG: hypothetical protein HY581_00850 [Nitrospirae bacterium]|nr:hypothetical protein [Nitrospirota bacterium]